MSGPRALPSILPLELCSVSFEAGGKRLVKDVSHTFGAGPRSIVLGPNGAGKSLLLRLCHGLLKPASGQILWHGGEPKQRQAMVFQRPVMLRRSARANVEYGLKLKGVAAQERRHRVDEALHATGLERLAGKPAWVLSFGEQQRLALARAWTLEPEILFLDEPTASLDPSATHAVEEIIAAIHASGTRIVMTTHDLPQARRLADEVLFMNRGRLLESGPAASFFAGPQNDLAQAFLRGELLWRQPKGDDDEPRRPPRFT